MQDEQSHKKIHEARLLALRGLLDDGIHHKQWFLERIAETLGIDLAGFRSELRKVGRDFKPGIAPPEKSPMRNTSEQKKIKYSVFVCMADADSCEECKNLNGNMWKPDSRNPPSFPVKNCKSKAGCRCEPVDVYEDEGTIQSAR
jgi:hypothetical protein